MTSAVAASTQATAPESMANASLAPRRVSGYLARWSFTIILLMLK